MMLVGDFIKVVIDIVIDFDFILVVILMIEFVILIGVKKMM